MTGISSYATMPYQRQNPFTRMDADESGTVSKDEFVASRPKDVSETDAAALYAKIDTDNTGALTADQLKAGMEANKPAKAQALSSGVSLSGDVVSALVSILQQSSAQASGAVSGETGQSQASDDTVYDAMDTDKDGTVSRAEFLAAKPDDLSETQAGSLFDQIDTEGTGSITKDQFAASHENGPRGPGGPNGPPPPPPSDTASAATAATGDQGSVSDALSTLMTAIKAYASSNKIDTAKLTDIFQNA